LLITLIETMVMKYDFCILPREKVITFLVHNVWTQTGIAVVFRNKIVLNDGGNLLNRSQQPWGDTSDRLVFVKVEN